MAEDAARASHYHERQKWELCALHALNNLFQREEFNRGDLDAICHQLAPGTWLNEHKSWIPGFGNYDYNVLALALKSRGYSITWFDARKDPSCIDESKLFGIIANIPSRFKLAFIPTPIMRRHWVTIRKLNSSGYHMIDSKEDSPVPIGNWDKLVAFLKQWIEDGDKQFMLVEKEGPGTS